MQKQISAGHDLEEKSNVPKDVNALQPTIADDVKTLVFRVNLQKQIKAHHLPRRETLNSSTRPSVDSERYDNVAYTLYQDGRRDTKVRVFARPDTDLRSEESGQHRKSWM